MYKCVEDYSAPQTMNRHNVLTINNGETLEFLEVCNKYWWKMRSAASGKVGLVPVNYLEATKQVTTMQLSNFQNSQNGADGSSELLRLKYEVKDIQEEKSSVLESIDRAIDAIYKNAGKRRELNHAQRTKLQKLIGHRRKVYSEYLKVKSPSANKHSSKMGATSSVESDIPQQPIRPAPGPPTNGRKRFSLKKLAPDPPAEEKDVPPMIGSELVEQVRISTGLTHAKSIIAVETMLMHIRHRVPGISNQADYILESLYNSQENAAKISDEELLETNDGQHFQALLAELINCKEDSQQRSWALHEDESVIAKCLESVLSIVHDANPQVCLAVVRQDSFDGLNALVEYYQMETRTSLRFLLLKVFCGCCALGKQVISQLLYTILPNELARDMQADTKDIQKLLYSAKLCTMIFSTGEPVPYQYYEYLNKIFVKFLVNTIENPPDDEDDDEEESITKTFVPLILSFNQHFEDVEKNIVMKVLSEKGTSRRLTEKLMLLVNRGDDPVDIFGFLDKCPNSLLKFFEDIFSSCSTSEIFFRNDLMVLIDIVLRQVVDLSPGDKLRTEYLSLLHGILSTTNYSEYKHQHAEVGKCLKRIGEEEGAEVHKDQLIVREILEMFPNILKK